jgi:hypothetical protein
MLRAIVLISALSIAAPAQVYSPKVLAKGQPDASDLTRLAQGIFAKYSAHGPREKAEAIWRFFLTDGRFVEPGFWYHIAGWAYEEPAGEVLDPVKLLNSYGFGLCYQIAPVLEATWRAGGFADARVWFLTGHTVAEVFYDGAYHYFDSDMMGYNKLADGSVASVAQIEADGSLITSKLKGPREINRETASDPWYPADVRAGAIGGMAELFTTAADNRLFPFERAPQGHTMDFVLRPGERLVRHFQPERDDLYYLPYKQVGDRWLEFPQAIAQYGIRTENGPHSQKDRRRWATGRLEYRPPSQDSEIEVHEVRSPYVIIDAAFQLVASLPSSSATLLVETSSDDGRTWQQAGILHGPHEGAWRTQPAVLTRSEHGRRTSVSGRYGYLVRLTKRGSRIRDLLLTTFLQLNPRSLPALNPGPNELVFTAGPEQTRRDITIDPAAAGTIASNCRNAHFVSNGSQGYWTPESDGPAEITFRVRAPLTSVHAGGRFLNLSTGIAPDKYTAEVRKVDPLPARHPEASLAWSTSPHGPFQTLWTYDPHPKWADGKPVDRVLLWPEVDRTFAVNGATEIFIRYQFRDLAVDQFRIAYDTKADGTSPLDIVHEWDENGVHKQHRIRVPQGKREFPYTIGIASDVTVVNHSVAFECPASGR